MYRKFKMAEDTGIHLDLVFKPDALPFAADCGGSAIKLVFARLHPDQPNNGTSHKRYIIEAKCFSREDIHEAGVFIKNYLPQIGQSLTLPDTLPTLYSTGVGANQLTERVKKSLNVDLKVLDELTVFVTTVRYLAEHVPKQHFLYEISPEVFAEIDEVFVATKRGHDAWSKNGTVELPLFRSNVKEKFWRRPAENFPSDVPYAEAAGDTMYPCLMVPLGSALTVVKVNKTGNSQLVGFSPRCGRMFLSVGQLLTGAKTFDELLELAMKGNSLALDQTAVDEAAGGQDTSAAYSDGLRYLKKTVLYAFGKGVNTQLSDWKKEDLARCLLRNMLEDIATEVSHTAREHNVHRVFFVGSLTNSKFIREEMARIIGFYNVFHPNDTARYEFIRYGGHLGALGALLSGCDSTST